MDKRLRLATVPVAMILAVSLGACSAPQSGVDEDVEGPGEAFVLEGETIATAELFACARDEGKVNIYTTYPVGTEGLWEDFSTDTGIQVEGLVLPTEKLTARINTEYAAKKFPADVIVMPDQTPWATFVERDMILDKEVPTAKTPEQYVAVDVPYHTVSLNANVPAYNTAVLGGDVPSSWQDLLDPRFDGKLAFKPIQSGSSGWSIGLFMRDVLGEDYWAEVANRRPVLETSVSAIGESLARGEVWVGLTTPPVVLDLQRRGAPVEMLWLEEGTPMGVYFIGQVSEEAGSSNPCAAELYVNWSLSKRGQDSLAMSAGEYPVHSDAVIPEVDGMKLPVLDEINPQLASTENWINLREQYVTEWESIFD